MEVNQNELITILKDKIALYEHLGIEVVSLRSDQVHFHTSLEKSHNHKGTAFGGSLYASAVLACYALVLAGLKKRNIPTENIVIAKGEIEYLRPVETDFEIFCSFPSAADEEAFYRKLQQNNSVRGSLVSEIKDPSGSLRAVLTGLFVVRM